MGFEASTCSMTRFRVVDAVPQALWPELENRLKQFAFMPIDDMPEMSASGWVAFEDMRDTEWQESPSKGPYILFSLRKDTRRIPAALIRKNMADALDKEKQERKERGLNAFISNERRKELREQVLLRLRARFLPVPAYFNVLWNAERGEVWLASTSAGIIDAFMDLFRRTFDVLLEQITPHTLALAMCPKEEKAIATVAPTGFNGEDTGSVLGAPDSVLGREFLTWLWFMSERRERFPERILPHLLDMDGRITVQGRDQHETAAVSSAAYQLDEARIGLLRGKYVTRARLRVGTPYQEYRLTLSGNDFAVSGLWTPTPVKDPDADPDAQLLEKISYMEDAVRLLDGLYRQFLALRLTPSLWQTETAVMRTWMTARDDESDGESGEIGGGE